MFYRGIFFTQFKVVLQSSPCNEYAFVLRIQKIYFNDPKVGKKQFFDLNILLIKR